MGCTCMRYISQGKSVLQGLKIENHLLKIWNKEKCNQEPVKKKQRKHDETDINLANAIVA